jgi:hypothetical protein
MSRFVPFTGQLYQLFSTRQLPAGAYVEVNGPHDRYGVVRESTPKDGKFLNLIRGVKQRNDQVQARF